MGSRLGLSHADRMAASPAYCLYCFETLSASFEGSEPPRLAKVEELWNAYQEATNPLTVEDDMGTDNVESEDDDEEIDSSSDDNDDGQEEDVITPRSKRSKPATLQSRSISRLQSTDTPSSSASSTTSLFTSTPNSSASSQTSYSSALTSRPPEPSYPIFVTWNTISQRSSSKHLRGCIGTFDPLPLSRGLETYALTSAFDDHRFSPIPSSLLPQLSCSITLLADFTTCSNPLDWELGTHGIRISFANKSKTRRYGATYLPDVAVEQGWTKEETVESLMRKAGWDGNTRTSSSSSSTYGVGVAKRLLRGSSSNASSSPPDPSNSSTSKQYVWDTDEVSNFKTVRYTGLKASANYAEWKAWRQWIEEKGRGKELVGR
ncbi:putative ammecr1 family protein [Phaeomoniella chlamydospora]|uniref:Putative ammecr1 family protein n=1 Tax=Phaeomoniella chlamydospora TaxID=158046 RepID=A0A0G2EHA6_PHACM|nr:putative ammecr1 family protein [Phaeomoniella chlamydospora]